MTDQPTSSPVSAVKKGPNVCSRKRKEKKEQEGWRETARFWFWAIVITLILRAFIIEPYRIPTPSMERTLLVGDFLFVSKLHYGPRTPNTIGVPFTRIHIRGLQFPQFRIPGFSSVKRGDVAVFNYPPETGAIERRTPYIKRLVAIPGDQLTILDKVLYVNDERYPLTGTQMHNWRVIPHEGQTLARGDVQSVPNVRVIGQAQQPVPAYIAEATSEGAVALEEIPTVGIVEPHMFPDNYIQPGIFPRGSEFNIDHYGPILVPGEGMTVELNDETWSVYRDVITRYERQSAERLADGTFQINGNLVTSYTFTQDYYFAMGDNRDNSEDSRIWGFVPHDHLVGKAVLVFFSLNLEDKAFGVLPLPRWRGLMPIR